MDTIITISDSFYEVLDTIGYYLHIFFPFILVLSGIYFVIEVVNHLRYN